MNVLFGTIIEQDLVTQHRYRVLLSTGETSPWLTALVLFAGAQRHNQALSLNTQVALIMSDYEGIILGAINDLNNPATTDRDTLNRTVYEDGAIVEYDSVSQHLLVDLPSGGRVTLVSDGGITLTGDVQLNGKLVATDDVIAAGISLKSHTHTGDSGGTTGGPQ